MTLSQGNIGGRQTLSTLHCTPSLLLITDPTIHVKHWLKSTKTNVLCMSKCTMYIIRYFVFSSNMYLDSPIQGSTGKLIVILRVDNDLHHIVGVSLKHLTTLPLLIPVPQLNQHVIWESATKPNASLVSSPEKSINYSLTDTFWTTTWCLLQRTSEIQWATSKLDTFKTSSTVAVCCEEVSTL